MQNTRGGQGTAENYIPDLPAINVLENIDHRTRIHLIHLLRDMQNDRYTRNDALEKAREKRKPKTSSSAPLEDVSPSKKKITAKEVMAEQNMFQEELLKVLDRQAALEATLNETIKTLNALQESFVAHISRDTAGATTAVNITPSRGAGDPTLDTEFFEFIDREIIDWDCYCEENLVCPKHPKKEPGQ